MFLKTICISYSTVPSTILPIWVGCIRLKWCIGFIGCIGCSVGCIEYIRLKLILSHEKLLSVKTAVNSESCRLAKLFNTVTNITKSLSRLCTRLWDIHNLKNIPQYLDLVTSTGWTESFPYQMLLFCSYLKLFSKVSKNAIIILWYQNVC